MRAPKFWSQPPGALAASLAPLSWVYEAAGALRRAVTTPVEVSAKVICIGNLVAGGAGKTPTAIAVLKRLRARGVAAHALTRGYGGREAGPLRVDPSRHSANDVGDEALLLARVAPTWVGRDRVAAARAAVADGARVIVMDDGFQNPKLKKDLSLVVVDADYGIGNGRVIPAGPLRESVAAGLARAQGVVMIGEGAGGFLGEVRPPVLRARIVPAPGALALADRAVLAFAGIGRPEKFFATLRALGCRLVASVAFADHHPYGPDDIMRLVEAAVEAGATLVTTEKDAVRLPSEARRMVEVLPVELVFEDEAALDRVLAPTLAHA
jgi:tetraacyldisaccharide 4'-kinase